VLIRVDFFSYWAVRELPVSVSFEPALK